MAATLTLDTVNGSYVELTGQTGGRVIRTGIVTGLPTTGVDPAEVLFLAGEATGMPARGSAHPTRSNLILASIGVYGLSPDAARVELNYEPFGSSAGVSYVIETATTLSTYETNFLPGTKVPLVVGFTPTDATKYEPIPESYVTMTFLRPIARIIVTQLRNGTLDPTTSDAFSENAGKVNASTWRGKPPGAWIIASASAVVSRYTGTYQTRIEAWRQGDDLWTGYGVVQSHLTGKFAYEAPAGGAGGTPAAINTLKSQAYSRGVTKGNGVLRADAYPTLDFASLFGF